MVLSVKKTLVLIEQFSSMESGDAFHVSYLSD